MRYQTKPNAAKSTADTAATTLRMVEGPDIEIEAIECSTTVFNLDTEITLHYRNYGRTRAKDFSDIFNSGVPPKPIIWPPPDQTFSGSLGAGAGALSTTTGNVRFLLGVERPKITPEQSFQEILSGKLIFGFWGTLKYTDVLDTNPPYVTHFYYIWDRHWPNKCVFTQQSAPQK